MVFHPLDDCPKNKTIFRSRNNCCYFESSFVSEIHVSERFLPAENRLQSALRPNGKVWPLCWRSTLFRLGFLRVAQLGGEGAKCPRPITLKLIMIMK